MPHPRPSHPNRSGLWLLLVLLLLVTTGSGTAQESDEDSTPGFQLVVHEDVPFLALERNTIAKMFLKQIKSWPDSDLGVQPVDLSETSDVRAAFTTTVHKKRISAISKYWQRQLFSGREVSPPKMATDEDVLEYVRTNPGAIGYVSDDTTLGTGVKSFSIGEQRADPRRQSTGDDGNDAAGAAGGAAEASAQEPNRP